MWPEPFEQTFVHLHMELGINSPVVSEEMFENVDRQTDTLEPLVQLFYA